MQGEFKFLGSSRSRVVTMVVDDLQIGHLARALVVAINHILTDVHLRREGNDVKDFVELVPMVDQLYGIVEAWISTGNMLLLKTLEERLAVATVLEGFEKWRQEIVRRQQQPDPGWPHDNHAAWMFTVKWDELNGRMLDADLQPA